MALVLAIGCAVTAAPPAHANEAARARFYFEQASAAFARGRYRAALDHFFAVQELAPSPGTLYSIAQCFDLLGETDEAYDYFSRFLDAAPDDMDPRFLETARRRRAALEPRVARIRIETEPPGALVYVDRRDLGAFGSTPLVLAVSPGRHALWLALPGHRTARVEVRADRGRASEVRQTLAPVRGTLSVRSEVEGPVLVTTERGETVLEGMTPLDAPVPPGLYVVEVTPPGHRPSRDVVRVEADASTELALRPEALPEPSGTLTITSNVQSAVVSIDGEAVGFTPTVLPSVVAGPRQIAVRSAGRLPYEAVVEVEPTRGFLNVTLEEPPTVERSPLTWVFGGVGATALAGAMVTGLLAESSNDELERALADPTEGDPGALRDRTLALRSASDGLWVGGAASLGVGVLLYFLTERTDMRPSRGSYQVEIDLP